MPEFKETPTTTVKDLINDAVFRINPRGKGCCYPHIGLQVMWENIIDLMALKCQDVKPYSGWQCQTCFSLTYDDDDDDDCFVCGGERLESSDSSAHPEEEVSSCHADVESLQSHTDSESCKK